MTQDFGSRIESFDRDHEAALRGIWFLGDVHGQFKLLTRTLPRVGVPPRWLVFLGDVDIDRQPFRQILAPLWRWNAQLRAAFIHGNHDADSYEHWEMLQQALEGQGPRKTVVVTHHAPHPSSIHPRFAEDGLNPAFASDLTRLMGKSCLWIHEHMHDNADYSLRGTRVICNPRGYPLASGGV